MDHIGIQCLRVNGMENGASMGIGPVLTVGQITTFKFLLGNGLVSGDCTYMPNWIGILNDPDLLDTPEWKFNAPPW
ncbi:MAG: hypothetical protein ACM3XM_15520 [Mycobacterium leprae]